MTGSVHLLRTAYKIDDMRHLSDVQSSHRLQKRDGRDVVAMSTRRTPTRANELMDGGSVYWIIKNKIACRQEIIDIETVEVDADSKRCFFYLDPTIHVVAPRAKRAVQGWRYLEGWDRPKDLGVYNDAGDDIPDEIEKELRETGLL